VQYIVFIFGQFTNKYSFENISTFLIVLYKPVCSLNVRAILGPQFIHLLTFERISCFISCHNKIKNMQLDYHNERWWCPNLECNWFANWMKVYIPCNMWLCLWRLYFPRKDHFVHICTAYFSQFSIFRDDF